MSEIEALLGPDEYIRANNLYGSPSRRIILLYGLVITGLVVTALAGDHQTRFIALGALAGGVVGHYAFARLLGPWLVRRNYRKYPLMQKPFFVRTEPDGITFRTENGTTVVAWKDILKWRENAEFILLYVAPNRYHIVPKQLAAAGLDLSALTRILRDTVGKAI